MSVTIKDVEHIAKLARLDFSEEEKQQFTHQLNRVLEYVGKLNELNTDNVEPLSHVIDISNRFRDDKVMPGLSTEEGLKNAPDRTDEFFKVPKVIGDK